MVTFAPTKKSWAQKYSDISLFSRGWFGFLMRPRSKNFPPITPARKMMIASELMSNNLRILDKQKMLYFGIEHLHVFQNTGSRVENIRFDKYSSKLQGCLKTVQAEVKVL